MDKINNRDKTWDKMTLEEKQKEIENIAYILENKKLNDDDILTKEGLEKFQEKYTRIFMRAVSDAIRKELKLLGEPHFYKSDKNANCREYFDYVSFKLDKKQLSELGVYLGYPETDKEDDEIRKSLWWGFSKWGKDNDIEGKIEEKFKNGELKESLEKLNEITFPGPRIRVVKGSLSSSKLREKQENPDKIIEEITNDLNDLYSKISDIFSNGSNTGENKIISILNAIETKPFIILSGISGTGKTQIARIISAGLIKDDR